MHEIASRFTMWFSSSLTNCAIVDPPEEKYHTGCSSVKVFDTYCRIGKGGMGEWLKPAVLKTDFSREPSPSKSTKSSCKPWAYKHFLVQCSSFSFIAFH